MGWGGPYRASQASPSPPCRAANSPDPVEGREEEPKITHPETHQGGPQVCSPRPGGAPSLWRLLRAAEPGGGARPQRRQGKEARRKQSPLGVLSGGRSPRCFSTSGTCPSNRKMAREAGGVHTLRGLAWAASPLQLPAKRAQHMCAHRRTHTGTRATISAHVHACLAVRLTSPLHGSVPLRHRHWPRPCCPHCGPRHCTAPP